MPKREPNEELLGEYREALDEALGAVDALYLKIGHEEMLWTEGTILRRTLSNGRIERARVVGVIRKTWGSSSYVTAVRRILKSGKMGNVFSVSPYCQDWQEVEDAT